MGRQVSEACRWWGFGPLDRKVTDAAQRVIYAGPSCGDRRPVGLPMFAELNFYSDFPADMLFLSKFAKAILDNCCGPPLKPNQITQSTISYFASNLFQRSMLGTFSALRKVPPVASLAESDTAFSWCCPSPPRESAIRSAASDARADFCCLCRSGAVDGQSWAHAQGTAHSRYGQRRKPGAGPRGSDFYRSR